MRSSPGAYRHFFPPSVARGTSSASLAAAGHVQSKRAFLRAGELVTHLFLLLRQVDRAMKQGSPLTLARLEKLSKLRDRLLRRLDSALRSQETQFTSSSAQGSPRLDDLDRGEA